MIELLKNPQSLAQMSMGQKLMGSLNVALLGLGTCFVVLGILIICITIMKKKESKEPVCEQKESEPEVKGVPAASSQTDGVAPEVVAAIVAALTMLKGNSDFRIKNITPRESKTAWTQAGRERVFAKRGRKAR